MKNKYNFLLISGLVLGFALTAFVFTTQANILSIILDPSLNISRFAPYKIKANISDNPESVSVDISSINGNVTNTTTCWNFFVDGRCDSDARTKSMINVSGDLWESTNIFPDDIYPEIFFVPSDITWYYAPEDRTFNRNNYQILKFNNPFEMVDGMSFFIEFNTIPQAINNSADLQVYLVAKNKDISFFNTDWRSSPDVSLVGTINRSQNVHHTHTSNSSHYLVALSTDSTGKVAGLDVSDDFWVILYNNSPNNNRGWSIRYHTICDAEASGYWYQGSQANWSTSLQTGCPDAHIHIARTLTDNNLTVRDGVQAVVTATYNDSSVATSSELIYFTPLINLAPNSTSFISPIIGNVYSAGPIEISWNPATDPNNDPLLYDIHLLDSEGVATSTLATATTTTSFSWDITDLPNGQYSLKGVITEDIPTDPLITDFFLGGNFIIDQAATLYSLSNINIASNNASTTLAKAGDVVTLSFSASGPIDPTIMIYSGDTEIASNTINIASSTNNFTVTYTVQESDDDGLVSFEISASNLEQTYNDTTDSSFVIIDITSPATVVASPGAGTYNTSQSVSLSSVGADNIRYTTDTSNPSCSVGTLYVSAITINEPTTIKAIACDVTGNKSEIATFEYSFQYSIIFNGNGGTGHAPTSKLVNHDDTTTLPSQPILTGYNFVKWNTQVDGLGVDFDETTVVTSNLTVYAIWEINKYDLIYNGNGNISGTPPVTVTYDYNASVTVASSTDLLKTDYAFYGWNTAADGSGISYLPDDSFNITTTTTLYAQWLELAQCTVTFNGNGGSGHTPGTKTFACEQSLDNAGLSLPSNPSRLGYTFDGWNIQADGSGDIFTINTTVSSNTTVYAQWSANTYTLNFNAQGGMITPTSTSVTFNAAVGELPIPTKDNYTFTTWNTEADGSGINYDSSRIYTVAADSTLYAQWSAISYNVIFTANSGVGDDYTQSIAFNSSANLLNNTFTKVGYTFSSWNTQVDGSGLSYANESSFTMNVAGVTLYAQWTPAIYLIAFNTQGGSSATSISVTYNTPIGTLPNSTKTGHTFSGWYTEGNGLGDSYTESTTYLLTENLVLIANWAPNVYTLTFDSAGGSAVSSITQDYNTSIIAPSDPTKIGHIFNGWDPVIPSAMPAGNQTHTAQWIANQYTLVYSAGENGVLTGTTSQTVSHGLSGSTVTAVPDEGYRFNRWSDNSTTNPRTDANVSGNISVTAEFLPVSSGGSTFTPPPAIGDGQVDITIPMNSTGGLGQVDSGGINYLSYVGSQANFSTPISTTNNLSDHWLVINNLDLNSQLITFTIKSEPQTFQLALGESVLVDLDGDGIQDIEVKFTDLLVNRSELTIRSVLNNQLINPPSQEISGLDREAIIKEARETFTKKNIALSNRLTGRILLQVEKHGQAWYLDPISQARYYLGRPVDAFAIMRHFGLGVSEEDFNNFSQSGAPSHLAGRIILRVEANGEAYYLNPLDLKMHYLGRPVDAFAIMKGLSLGISNVNLNQLLVGEID